MEDLAWQNGSRFYAILYQMGTHSDMTAHENQHLASSFLTTTSALAFSRIQEVCRALAGKVEDIASTPSFACRCSGKISAGWCMQQLEICMGVLIYPETIVCMAQSVVTCYMCITQRCSS